MPTVSVTTEPPPRFYASYYACSAGSDIPSKSTCPPGDVIGGCGTNGAPNAACGEGRNTTCDALNSPMSYMCPHLMLGTSSMHNAAEAWKRRICSAFVTGQGSWQTSDTEVAVVQLRRHLLWRQLWRQYNNIRALCGRVRRHLQLRVRAGVRDRRCHIHIRNVHS
mgnify:CR=1 FL=1